MTEDVRGRVVAWHDAWLDQLRAAWPEGVPLSADIGEVFSQEQILRIGKLACEQSGVVVDDLDNEDAYRELRELFKKPRTFANPWGGTDLRNAD